MATGSIVEDILAKLGGPIIAKGLGMYSLTEGNEPTLLDTPGLWGSNPGDNGYWNPPYTRTAPTPKCKRLLEEMEQVVGSAQSCLDITTLWHTASRTGGFPDVFFLDALKKGFARIVARGSTPVVRILIGVPVGVIVSVNDMANWLNGLIPQNANLTVYMATNHTTPTGSWNHSKIIAADGRQAIVGGHNLWSSAYMTFAPVHDVSMLVKGPAARTAHTFCNLLWRKPFDKIKWHRHSFESGQQPPDAPIPDCPPAGQAKVLAVCRLGTGIADVVNKITEASVYARVAAILSAKRTIRLSQQGLGFQFLHSDISSFDVPTMAALAKAMHNGVTVQVVMSNDGAKDGAGDPYSGTDVQTTLMCFGKFAEWEMTRGFPPANNPDEYFALGQESSISKAARWNPAAWYTPNSIRLLQEMLYLTTLRFSPAGGNWESTSPKLSAIPGNHAKVYIIDDTNYYVGSDNMYRSGPDGLQEFGYLVEGQRETQRFISEYWEPLWQYSNLQRQTLRPPKG